MEIVTMTPADLGGPAGATDPAGPRFPSTFVWGTSTSAYQIEGATAQDGRGESIWDRFCSTAGNIADGSSGAVACDHYNRWEADVELMRSLSMGAYRFSIAWPRVLPDGVGRTNEAGLDFYDRLVDGLLAAGIEPFPTLYHWDLPQALEDRGGWTSRLVPEAFADYAELVVARLGDRIGTWTTINEPFVVANHGYLTGEHAPGRGSLAEGLAASHHVLLAHGMALERIRSIAPHAKAGITVNFTPAFRTSEAPAAVDRFQVVDDLENWWYISPVAGHGYPQRTVERLGWQQHEVRDDDLALISQPIDFLGVNFYTRQLIGAVEGEGRALHRRSTAMGWEVHAESFGWLMRTLHERFPMPAYYVTENGAAMPDTTRRDGRVADADRIAYLREHLAQLQAVIEEGVPVKGYFAWSLLDNFEWAHGYRYRFGLVEVAPDTLERIPKESAHWYAQVARTGYLDGAADEVG
ncbi:MAG: beta-glucosidase [Ilumatobacteraceae bacterium]|nr:beta-glucosidase [Ilumatobacteraceae bacterium]